MTDLKTILYALRTRASAESLSPHRKSSLGTWAQCRVRHELEYRWGLESPSGEAAELGTRAHAWLEGMLGSPGDPEAPIPEDLEELRDGLLWAATLAFNLTEGGHRGDTSAEWSFGKGERPPLRLDSWEHGSHRFAGTADLVWTDADGVENVLDYKTGWGHLPDPRESLELALYALAVGDAEQGSPVRVHYALLRTREHRSALLTPEELRAWAERLCALALEVETAEVGAATPNRYCASCAASGVCPALRRGGGDPVERLEAARAAAKLADERLRVAERAALAAAEAGDARLRVVTPTRRAYDAALVWRGVAPERVGELAALVYPRISATGARALSRAGVGLGGAEVEVEGEKKVEVVPK